MSQAELFPRFREPLAPPPAPRSGAAEGERRKKVGMQLAATSKAHLLGIAREMAIDIARGVEPHADGQKRADGLCTADDVAALWQRENDAREADEKRPWIGNAAGSIFTGGNWEWTGQFVKSARAHANANLLRVWRLKHPVT